MTSLDTDYGLLAREMLALARGGTLHVRGIDDATPTDAMFYDNEGLPTFVVDADTPLVVAAREGRGAVLGIPADAESPFTQLVLGGDLALLEGDDSEGADDAPGQVVSIALVVHTVVLERDDAQDATVSYRTVAFDDWTRATPDPMRPAARRILTHTNAAHGEQLREFVAGLRAMDASDVLAAELAGLDATGVDVMWLDTRGAHRARIRFSRPAGCPGELAAALRAQLQGH